MSTLAANYRRVFDTDKTGAFVSVDEEASEPTRSATNGILSFDAQSSECDLISIIPFCDGGEDETVGIRLWGYTKVDGENLWIPSLIFQGVATLGDLEAMEQGDYIYPDTIVKTYGNDESLRIFTNANNLHAFLVIDHFGFQKFKIDLNPSSGNANAFWRPIRNITT